MSSRVCREAGLEGRPSGTRPEMGPGQHWGQGVGGGLVCDREP